MRTRIFQNVADGGATAAWQEGDATTGQGGTLLPFSSSSTGLPAGGDGNLAGPGSFVSAQFSLAAAPSSLIVALGLPSGDPSAVSVELQEYTNFAWRPLDRAGLGDAPGAPAVALPAGRLGLVRLKVAVNTRASARCAPLLNASAAGASNPPTAAFTASPLSGPPPLAVQFTDGSSGQITGRAWNFGDGAASNAASPAHTFAAAGNYPVTLTATGPGGSSSASRVVQVTAAPAGVSADERAGVVPIPAGSDQVAITFTPPFSGGAPLPPECQVVVPAGADHLTDMGVQNLTAAGCTVLLSAAAPVAGYQLGFRALRHP